MRILWVLLTFITFFSATHCISEERLQYDAIARAMAIRSFISGQGFGPHFSDFGAMATGTIAVYLRTWLTSETVIGTSLYIHSIFFVACWCTFFFLLLIKSFSKELPGSRVTLFLWLIALACCPLLFSSTDFLLETPECLYVSVFGWILLSYRQGQDFSRHESYLLGIFAFFIIITRTPYIFIPIAAGSGLFYIKQRKAGLATVAGMIAGLGVCLWWNYYRFGHVLAFSYGDQRFDQSLIESWYAYLFSPGKSIFLFAPWIVCTYVFYRSLTKNQRVLFSFLMMGCFAVTCVFGKWWAFHGGLSYGPRFLLPILSLLTLFAFTALLRMKWQSTRKKNALLLAFIAWGAAVQLPALVTDGYPYFNEWTSSFQRLQPHIPLQENIPSVEKRSQISFPDQLSIYDPWFSPLGRGWHFVLTRFDLWEVPWLHFDQRFYRVTYEINTKAGMREVAIAAQGYKNKTWNPQNIAVTPSALAPVVQKSWNDAQATIAPGMEFIFHFPRTLGGEQINISLSYVSGHPTGTTHQPMTVLIKGRKSSESAWEYLDFTKQENVSVTLGGIVGGKRAVINVFLLSMPLLLLLAHRRRGGRL